MSLIMRYLCVFVVMLIFVKCITPQLKQARATMDYCHPKYVSDCYAITRRERRREPYKTNFTMNSRYTSGTNVTMKVVLITALPVELMKMTVCDISQIVWLYDFVKLYAGVDARCPYKPGKYGLYNLELPPKNMPQRIVNLLEGKFHAKFYFQITKTEELLIESTILLQS